MRNVSNLPLAALISYLDDDVDGMHTDVHIQGIEDSDDDTETPLTLDKSNNFRSTLPDDTKTHLKKVAEENVPQSLDKHLNAASPEEKPELYSDELFERAAIQWLIETNQVHCFTSNNFRF